MKKSAKIALALAAAAPLTMVAAPEQAQAQSIFEGIGDDIERNVRRNNRNTIDDIFRDARRQREQARRDQQNRQREVRRNYQRVPEEAAQYVNRNGGNYRALRDCAYQYVARDGLTARTAVRLCADSFNNTAGRQQYAPATPNRPAPQNRQEISRDQWDYIIAQCVTQLGRENPGQSYSRLQNSCEQGFSRHYTVRNVRYNNGSRRR